MSQLDGQTLQQNIQQTLAFVPLHFYHHLQLAMCKQWKNQLPLFKSFLRGHQFRTWDGSHYCPGTTHHLSWNHLKRLMSILRYFPGFHFESLLSIDMSYIIYVIDRNSGIHDCGYRLLGNSATHPIYSAAQLGHLTRLLESSTLLITHGFEIPVLLYSTCSLRWWLRMTDFEVEDATNLLFVSCVLRRLLCGWPFFPLAR